MRAAETRHRPQRTLALAAVTCTLATAVVLVVPESLVDHGTAPPFMRVDTPDRSPLAPDGVAASARRGDVLELAGSGSNLRVTRALAAAFATPDRRVVVHQSVGSRGGARATIEREVDLGLMSRSLEPAEVAQGLVLHPYARAQVVLAASPDVRDPGISLEDLQALLRGQPRRWSDGRSMALLMRDAGDSSNRALAAALPGLGADLAGATAQRRWRVLRTDAEMLEALSGTPAALGMVDAADVRRVRPELHELQVLDAGVAVPLAAFRQLSLASVGEARGVAADFIAFATSEAGRAIVRALGYEPADGTP